MKTKVRFMVITVFACLLGTCVLIPLNSVQAAYQGNLPGSQIQVTETPPLATGTPSVQAQPNPNGNALENVLIREKLAVERQQLRLKLSHAIANRVQIYIDNHQNSEKDISALEIALSNFNQAISQAETSHTAAETLLTNPAGFDSSGQVVDRIAALKTLRDAGQLLIQTHLTLTQATLELRLAIQTYRLS